MTVLLVLFTFVLFLAIDYFKTETGKEKVKVVKVRPAFTTPGFECLGALAQDGGTPAKDDKGSK